jgi:hypothetical protein
MVSTPITTNEKKGKARPNFKLLGKFLEDKDIKIENCNFERFQQSLVQKRE